MNKETLNKSTIRSISTYPTLKVRKIWEGERCLGFWRRKG